MPYNEGVLRALVLSGALLLAACTSGDPSSAADPSAAPSSDRSTTSTPSTTEPDLAPYEDPHDWLCHPDLADTPCTRDVSIAAVANDDVITHRTLRPEDAPAVDCFYVHPTIGEDPDHIGDLDPGEAEQDTTFRQAAPLGSVCQVFAPIYREATFHTLDLDAIDQEALDVAYGDVLDAFDAYMARWNNGRPFVLVGHSQGSAHLLRLLADRVEGDAALGAQLMGAYLPGTPVDVDDSGALLDAPSIGLCRTVGEWRCVVAFSSYDVTNPPQDDALFGHTYRTDGARVGCVNPAGLTEGDAALDPLVPRATAGESDPRVRALDDAFVTYPDRLTARCVDDGRSVYLQVTSDVDRTTPDVESIPTGDEGRWGLHSLEFGLVLGNLLDLIEAQAAAR